MRFIIPFITLFALISAQDNDEPSSRIIGGSVAQRGKYNYMVHIIINNSNMCGGSLIAKDTVLTAAHCIAGNNPGSYNVRGNIHNIRSERGEQLRVTQVITHPQFNRQNLDNDIAILKINPSHNINSFLTLDTNNSAQINNQVLVTGWGRTQSFGQSSDVLKELNMKVLDPQVCSRNVAPLNERTHFCATGVQNGSSACQGDSGSPVVSSDLRTIVGLVSYGTEGCNAPSAAFTRISNFASWIRQYSSGSGNPGQGQGNPGQGQGNPGQGQGNPGIPSDNSYPKGSCTQPGETICFSPQKVGVCANTQFAYPYDCPPGTTCKQSNGRSYCQ
ncbi:trypsin-like serine protease [Neoconidiobolus thromboides FSU 785]|nr:trypsin-like serine protease [Neoconidiobolus thromboides FSU 785]